MSQQLKITMLAVTLAMGWLGGIFLVWIPMLTRPGDAAILTRLFVQDVTGLSVWVAAWTWLDSLHGGRVRLGLHVSVACTAGLVDILVVQWLWPWLLFLIGWPWHDSFPSAGRAVLLVLAALLHLHFVQGVLKGAWLGLWALGSALALALTGASLWADSQNANKLDRLPYEPNVYMGPWIPKPALGLEDGLTALWAREWGEPTVASETEGD